MKRAVAIRGRVGAHVCALVFASFSFLLPGRADARPRPDGGTPFQSNKVFGFGIMIGEPIGLTAKYYLGPSTAIDFAFGEYDRFREDDDLGAHADFLWHPVAFSGNAPFVIPLYFGIGGRVVGDDDGADDDELDLGVRVPVGVALDFNRVPIDVFFELAIAIDLINDDDDDDVDLDAGLGVRYYF